MYHGCFGPYEFPSFVRNGQKHTRYVRIEKNFRPALNFLSCRLQWQCGTIGPIRRHGIDSICNGENPRTGWNLFSFQTLWIATAVVTLKVRKDNLRSRSKKRSLTRR